MARTTLTDRLSDVCVGDVMHPGVIRCRSDATLAEVAALMSARRVHAVAVVRAGGLRPHGFVSDADLVAALAAGAPFSGRDALTARDAAATVPLGVSTAESVTHAAELMRDHNATHLLVLDHAGGYPVGVVSSLDLLSAAAGVLDGGAIGSEAHAAHRSMSSHQPKES